MNYKFLNSVFLVSGTAIGSGLLSLPLSAVKLGMQRTLAWIAVALWVAYQTSCLTIELMKIQGRPLSIVELAHELSGKGAKGWAMGSLYSLSLALLCAYFSGTASVLGRFLGLGPAGSVGICVVVFSLLFLIRVQTFNRINSGMVFILLAIILGVIGSTPIHSLKFADIPCDSKTFWAFLPIIFTSFGVQNVCPFVAQCMGLENLKAIRRVFLLGTCIPALVYILWIYAVLARVSTYDPGLYHQMLKGGVSVGALVESLCHSVPWKWGALVLQALSLLAILTSAAGTGVGLISSLRETVWGANRIATLLLVIGIPTLLTWLLPNGFVRILSLGGMIATIFVIFIPVYLKAKVASLDSSNVLCLLFGVGVVLAELFT